jgi:Lactonase, 7-bladed beta-propeller
MKPFVWIVFVGFTLAFNVAIAQQPVFEGEFLATINDGDYLASTYNDGQLPLRVPDYLSILSLPFSESATLAQLEVSNSVVATPFVMDISPDGQTLFITETRGQSNANITTSEALPKGQRVTAVDVSNPQQPRESSFVDIGPVNPETVSVHPEGDFLLVTTQTLDSELVIIPVTGNTLGEPQIFALSDVGIEPDPSRFQEGMYTSYAQWHPSGNYIAVNLPHRDTVFFVEVQQTESGLSLELWGDPLYVGKDPFVGRFTPDGKYYLTSNWGRNFGSNITTLEARLPITPSQVAVIQMATPGTPSGEARHTLVSTAPSDLSSEGLAISPDGSLVVTVNMRGSAFPKASESYTPNSSLSLFTLDNATGQLTKIDDYSFTGILPESAAFDTSGNFLAVVVFDYPSDMPEGGLEIWQVVREDGQPRLEKTETVIDVGRGAHQVIVTD